MTETELDLTNGRYETLNLIEWFDIERVRAAKVLVVGAGAIGNEVLKNLALLGMGNIYIFDRDTIELSNLSRSILYRASDSGKPKAATAARALKEINPDPDVNVFYHHGEIATDLGEGLVRKMDVVIGCLDSLDARFLLNRICWRAGRPWVDAGIGALNGEVRVFNPPDGPCYECSFTEQHYDQLTTRQAKPCNQLARAFVRQGRIPTTPMIASLVAAVQVQECLKLLDAARWEGRTLSGRLFIFNGTVGHVDIVGLPRREDCPAHVEIDPEEIVALPDMSADCTAGQLLEKARELLGPSAHLYLDIEVAIERKCAGCGDTLPLLRPVHNVYAEQLTCALCHHECRYESDITFTHVVGSRTPAALLGVKLSDLGVPRFGVVEARGPGGLQRYLELSGDAEAIMASPYQATT